MTPNFILRKATFILFYFFVTGVLVADTLDHTLFLQQIDNSHDLVYNDCLKKYDDYLKYHPDDVTVHIEKCKFIQFAQYEEDESYNPNQEAFDSCASALIKLFPSHPEIFIFQISYLWGDELKYVLDEADWAIDNKPYEWNDHQAGIVYKHKAIQYYSESVLPMALIYIRRAISRDSTYQTSLDHARILIGLDRKPEALQILKSGKDTTKIAWELSNKADLYLELEDYESALILYNRINEIDSTFNQNLKIANTLEGVGQYQSARKYLEADTSTSWDKETALKQLLIHDLKYQSGAQCLSTYNAYRDYGYSTDPLGIFRVKLFLSHPLQPWKLRDILGLITLNATFLLLIGIPFIWILPVYFIGHHLNFIKKQTAYKLNWGLQAFWFVSAGYLISSFVASWVAPEHLYSLLMNSYYENELSQETEGLISILFLLLFAIVAFATLYGINPKTILGDQWTLKKMITNAIGLLILYKIISGIYLGVVFSVFGLTMDDISGMLSHFLATRQEIEAILAVSGTGAGIILVCVLVPLYEELVFRGVILDACERYLTFNSANFIQAALFATIHLNLYLFPVFLLFGLVGGFMRKKSGGLLAGIIFHVINNLLAISVFLLR